MGKDLKGKNLGTGISQRKDGLYYVRISRNGDSSQRCFKKLKDAKTWLLDQQYAKERLGLNSGGQMCLDKWYEYWMENIKNLKFQTIYHQNSFYKKHISPQIGRMKLCEIKPIHCMKVLQTMAYNGHANGTIVKIRSILHDCLESAVENDFILKNPVTRSVKIEGKERKEAYIMNKKERAIFAEVAKSSVHYLGLMFVLETGLRWGELAGLKWKDINIEKRRMNIERSIYLKYNPRRYIEGTTKSKAGIRVVPLSNKAIEILKEQKEKKKNDIVSLGNHEYVFTNKNGNIVDATVYNDSLKPIMRKMGLPSISIHTLRHTFATSCIERGMQPKTLQKIIGHSRIETTMNLYVHVTDEFIFEEFEKIQKIAI